MVQQEETEGGIQGVAVCRGAPRVSHLLFIDETLLFYQETIEAMECIKKDAKVGAKRLSQAGSIVLVKAVAQAIPKYVMGCFLLPDRLLYDLESMSANFFWQHGEKQSTHWLSWKKLCRNKQGRGLGFRSWKTFNMTDKFIEDTPATSKVYELLLAVGKSWNEDLVRAEFGSRMHSASCLLSFGIPRHLEEVCFLSSHAQRADPLSRIFSGELRFPPKVQLLAWRACRMAIQVCSNLMCRGLNYRLNACGVGMELRVRSTYYYVFIFNLRSIMFTVALDRCYHREYGGLDEGGVERAEGP
ncbi:UNVERIFIED_CONTAM: hypothetical protein Sradi_2016900 [Sesamum radiatum]|uniref:Uncharacterized protein n=1 Tax=Sesamum radiatum TaxID=300843 RepID=A0AAW2TGE2_SESRA